MSGGVVRVALDDDAFGLLVAGRMATVRGVSADGMVEVEVILSDIGSPSQLGQMAEVRARFEDFAQYLDGALPDGPDKTYVLRQLRDCAMWSNVTLVRTADGTPRD
jgi:hypothetical protein